MLKIDPLWKLFVDWGNAREITNPTWQHVVAAIRGLNGSMQSELVLSAESIKGSLLIGGGNEGRYIVAYFPDDAGEECYTLTDPAKEGPDVEVVISQPSTYPASWCTDVETAISVAKTFFETTQLPEGLRWEVEPGKAVEL